MRFDENLYQSLFETASEAMFLLRDGQCVHCNASGVQLLQFSRDEIIGKMFVDFLPIYQPDREESAPMLLEKEQLALNDGEQIFNLMLEDQKGTSIYTRASFNALQVGGKTFIRVSLQEISGEIQLAQELAEIETQRLARRRRQIQLATQVNQAISGAVSLDDLYQRVVSQIKEQFHYYHVQLLRYDSVTKTAVLVAGYGDVGKEMLAQSRRIPLDKSLIGNAISSEKSILQTNLVSEPSWRADPLLPDTESELVVPIKLGNEILGVLDVQSDVAGLLDADDQLMLEEVCGQIAIAIERTALRQEMEAKLRELNTLQQLTTLDGWRDFTTQKTQSTLGYTFKQGSIDTLADAEIEAEASSEVENILYPMNIHGHKVGDVGVFDDPDEPLSDEEKSLLADVTLQVTQALERARLFEQTRHQAAELRNSLEEAETLYRASRAIGEAMSIDEIVRGAGQLSFSLNMAMCTITRFHEFDETGIPIRGDLYSVQVRKNELVPTPLLDNIKIWDGQAARQSLSNPKMVIIYRDTENPDENIDPPMQSYLRGMKMRGGILLGLHARGKPVGLLAYYSVRPLGNISANYIRQMRTVADQVVIALENRQLLLEAQSRARREQLSREIVTKLSGSVDVDIVLRTALKELNTALGVSHAIAHLGTPVVEGDLSAYEFTHVDVLFSHTWDALMSNAGAYLYSHSDNKFHDAFGQWRQEMLEAVQQKKSISFIAEAKTRLKSALAVPIILAGQVLGVIDLYDENVSKHWSADDIALVENVAAQVGLSLDNARLFADKQMALENLEEQARRPRLLNEMNQVLSRIDDEQRIFDQAVDYIKNIARADDVEIFGFNQSTDMLKLIAHHVDSGDLSDEMVECGVSDTLLGSVLMRNQQQIKPESNLPATVYVEIIADTKTSDWKDIQRQTQRGLQSIMVAPILSNSRVIALLNIASSQTGAYQAHDESFLVQIALLLSAAIENRRLLKQTESALLDTERLYTASQNLNAADNLQEVLRVVQETFPIPDVNRALLMTIDRDALTRTERFTVLANWHNGIGFAPVPVETQFSYQLGQSMEILSRQDTQFISNTQSDKNLDPATKAWAAEHKIGAMAIFPLRVGQRHLGVLVLQSENVHYFSPYETQPYVSIITQVATIIENQQLLAQSQQALLELEETQQRYTQQSWEVYRNMHSDLSYEALKSSDVSIPPLPDETLKMVTETQTQIVHHQFNPDANDAAELILPLIWRDEVTGVLAVQDEVGKPRQWLPEEIELVQAIVNEFVQVADSLRLLDETQRRAARETRINDINEKIQSAQSMEEALRIAVKEVGLSLNAPQTTIQLSVEAEE